MSRPLFSIITVCYNAGDFIGDTIDSVVNQSFSDYEYIIKDGQSEDATMGIVNRLTKSNEKVRIIEGTDQGIYDAMNIAVAQAQGFYVVFMNAGDVFADRCVLEKVYNKIEKEKDRAVDIYYGNVFEKNNGYSKLRTYKTYNSWIWYYCTGACLCHQTMFCAITLFRNKKFDVLYRVCADREWQMYHISNHVKTEALKFPVASILTEGFSSQNVSLLENETKQCIKKYAKKGYILYCFILLLKKNKFIHAIIKRIESVVSY